MIYVAIFVIIFTAIQLVVALSNKVFVTSLPNNETLGIQLVSVLIPARNEEKNIATILTDLQQQEYKNIEIIVFNDLSDDRTAQIVESFCATDNRIKLLNSDGLPSGWLGKNFACHSLAQHAKGDYYLFLDADVRVQGNIIAKAINFSQKHHLGLISIFPKQIIKTLGEKITVPIMNYILLSLLPLIQVRKSKNPAFSAANGQFMFFSSSVYKKYNPHELVKTDKVEDISIARLLKKEGIPIACLVGDSTIQCRMYEGFSDSVNGFSKNVTAFFGNSFVIALLFWIVTTWGWLFILLNLPLSVFYVYLIIYLLTRIIISIVSRQNIILNILFVIPQQISCGMFIYKAVINKFTKNYQWKQRSIN